MKTIVINLFGAPGAGKSTGAAYVFSQLKLAGYNVELVTEVAKDLVWENNTTALNDQIYVLGQQNLRLSRLIDKVDIIITDSPLLLSSFYNKRTDLDYFKPFVQELFNSYFNVNYFVQRVKPYNPIGRLQTEIEAEEYEKALKQLLKSSFCPYICINGDKSGYDKIIKNIKEVLEKS